MVCDVWLGGGFHACGEFVSDWICLRLWFAGFKAMLLVRLFVTVGSGVVLMWCVSWVCVVLVGLV